MNIRIGSIYACIDGDRRYGTTLEVELTETGTAQVVLVSTSPVGGMDGPGGTSHDRSVVGSCAATPRELLALLKRLFKTVDCGTIARYGKPFKRFAWNTDDGYENGFNAVLAKAAIERALCLRANP